MTVEQADNEHITIQVLGQNNTMVRFRTKTNIRMLKIMVAYGIKTGLEIETLKFRYDGNPVYKEDTPLSIQIKDNGVIEVYEEQIGA